MANLASKPTPHPLSNGFINVVVFENGSIRSIFIFYDRSYDIVYGLKMFSDILAH